jgi:hypothetical protein
MCGSPIAALNRSVIAEFVIRLAPDRLEPYGVFIPLLISFPTKCTTESWRSVDSILNVASARASRETVQETVVVTPKLSLEDKNRLGVDRFGFGSDKTAWLMCQESVSRTLRISNNLAASSRWTKRSSAVTHRAAPEAAVQGDSRDCRRKFTPLI